MWKARRRKPRPLAPSEGANLAELAGSYHLEESTISKLVAE
jgi:hypothetical protein